jgi:hypothetical protein
VDACILGGISGLREGMFAFVSSFPQSTCLLLLRYLGIKLRLGLVQESILLDLAVVPLTAISDKDADVLRLCHGTGALGCLVVVASKDRFETVVCRVLP